MVRSNMFEAVFSNPQSFNASFNSTSEVDASLLEVMLIETDLPKGGNKGDILVKLSDDDGHVDWVHPAEEATFDDDRPITSDAVARLTEHFDNVYSDTESNWNRQLTLVSEKGAIYIFTNHSYIEDQYGNIWPVPAIKIGDGNAYVVDLPFISDYLLKLLLNHTNNSDIHVSAQEKQFWNNKVTAFVDNSDPEKLVLSKTILRLED